ncbi:MAG: hypothetical protein RR239_05535, partial [Oscillospiraceae bacterium]
MKLNEKTISNILLVIVTMIIASTILGMLFLGETYVESKGITENNSTFDLSAISPDNNETYYLEGNWDFYYGQLLITDNIKGKDMTSIQVPSSWSGTPIMDTNFKSGGYASYRAKIKNCKAFEAITIYVPNLAGAYSVFVNGQLVSKSGTFSKDSGKVFATPTVDTNPIYLLPDQTYEIVIEVAAESYSGLYLTPLLTNYEHNTNYTTTMLGLRYALVGIVFFCGAAVIFLKSLGNKKSGCFSSDVKLTGGMYRFSLFLKAYSICKFCLLASSVSHSLLKILGSFPCTYCCINCILKYIIKSG